MTIERADGPDPHRHYHESEAAYARALEQLKTAVKRVETFRLVTFLVALGALIAYLDGALPAVPASVVGGVALVVFGVFVARHRRLRRELQRTEKAHGLARLGLLRLARDWDGIQEQLSELGYTDPYWTESPTPDRAHPYRADLDLFGSASLRALLGVTPSPRGPETLADWLSEPAPVADVRERQIAVQELTDDVAGREARAIDGLLHGALDERAWLAFLQWVGDEPLIGRVVPRWTIWAARILPPISLTLMTLELGFEIGPRWAWIAGLVVQGAIAWRWAGPFNDTFALLSGGGGGLRRLHPLFAGWEEHEAEAVPLMALRDRLRGSDGASASQEVAALERWIDTIHGRMSMMYAFFALGALWDFHILHGIETWRERAGRHVDGWFDALGQLEALAALAVLAHDHPNWCWPTLRAGDPGLEAEDLGHPLLAGSVLRTSDVAVQEPGRFLLVTGSNMSGKSTLLRSLGLAAVLGQAGGPVCARRCEMTPLRVFTSMRVQDSIADGVSLFMAELQRLKALVDEADNGTGDAALLYLIDEVLQGTNSEERRIAARRIVAHLLNTHAVGAVTTHDLSLHEDDRLDGAATKVHFREQVGGQEGGAVLSFDYQLRPGLATSRNALKLLEIVGLNDTGEDHNGGAKE